MLNVVLTLYVSNLTIVIVQVPLPTLIVIGITLIIVHIKRKL
jgi:hypothetical protein